MKERKRKKRATGRLTRGVESEDVPVIASVLIRRFRNRLLRWARESGRHFFWRKEGISPFAILITETLLSRTRAESVEPVAGQMLARFPNATTLARADPAMVEKVLYPLGLHHKRASYLIACAKALLEVHGGEVPRQMEQLLALPYVGRYGAAAVACFAFGERRAVIDANVSRVYQRGFSFPIPPPRLSSADTLWDFAERLVPQQGAKEFNWAVLDLGGTICTPRRPSCNRCPLKTLCNAYRVRKS